MFPVNPRAVAGYTKLILAEHQPDFIPVPALKDAEKFLTEWQLTDEDLRVLQAGGRIRFWQWGARFQPISLSVVSAEEALPLEVVT